MNWLNFRRGFSIGALAMLDYIFGYGSLINTESRVETAKTGPAIAVRVRELQRKWNFVSLRNAMTALGAIAASKEGSVNGVLFSVSPDGLSQFDQRESGYIRVPLKQSTIARYDGQQLPEGEFWTYVTKDDSWHPTMECPILQSYLDVVICGCLEIKEEFAHEKEAFAHEFVRTTENWNCPIENDRASPKYERPIRHAYDTSIIDRILTASAIVRPLIVRH
jgi:hypothetical protein